MGLDGTLSSLVGEAVDGGADALGMAGGDGSLAIVAAAARASRLPFVCIPAGTRNHFALDLGVDRHDLVGALEAFTDGVERLIDVGSVNGRLFLNNVSLGIYGEAVRESTYRDAKARTLLETAREVLGPSAAAPELRVVDDLGHAASASCGRPRVEQPVRARSPGGAGHPPEARRRPSRGRRPRRARYGPLPGRAWTATSVEVHGPAPVHAGIDGEAVDLSTPLDIEILPAALRVRISARHPGVSPSGRLS